jgi:hypothetical protein
MQRVRDAAGRIILTIDGLLPPGAQGPPLHVHFNLREEGVVKAGVLGAQVGKEKITVPTGGEGVFHAGIVHAWWNAGNDLLEFSGRAVPVDDLDRYLQGVFAVLNAGPHGRPSLFYLAHVMWRHRHQHEVAWPPRTVQRLLFPLILFVGHALGKYNGDNWPGSPASCPGAPDPSSS